MLGGRAAVDGRRPVAAGYQRLREAFTGSNACGRAGLRLVPESSQTRHTLVWFRYAVRRSIDASPETTWRSMSMLVRMMRREDGQGTVEYVGIMLLLATVLTAVVAAASGKDFNLATTIVNEVKQAISGVGGK
jgi:Flp pilus assembly pilin Flp